MKLGLNILVAAALAAAALGAAQDVSAQSRAPQAGKQPGVVDVARQLRFRLKLAKAANGDSLAMAINRQEWDRLTPDERDKYRREALAFLNKTPQEQEKAIKHYEELIKLTPEKREAYLQRAQWLKVVVASFTAQERTELTQLPAEQRAKKLLERKALLIKQGKLAPDAPATQPAKSQPASTPATQD